MGQIYRISAHNSVYCKAVSYIKIKTRVVTRNCKCMAEMLFQEQKLLFQKNEIFLRKKTAFHTFLVSYHLYKLP